MTKISENDPFNFRKKKNKKVGLSSDGAAERVSTLDLFKNYKVNNYDI